MTEMKNSVIFCFSVPDSFVGHVKTANNGNTAAFTAGPAAISDAGWRSEAPEGGERFIIGYSFV